MRTPVLPRARETCDFLFEASVSSLQTQELDIPCFLQVPTPRQAPHAGPDPGPASQGVSAP